MTQKENDGNGLQSFNGIEEKIDFKNIRPFTRYIVQVAVYNSAGCGPKSEKISFTTAEAGITICVVNKFSILAVDFISLNIELNVV